jgi:threonine dehydrogenase-like Zn-dependent dehydrogenase
MMGEGKVDVSSLISHKLSLDEIEKGFQLMEDSTADSMKILFYS